MPSGSSWPVRLARRWATSSISTCCAAGFAVGSTGFRRSPGAATPSSNASARARPSPFCSCDSRRAFIALAAACAYADVPALKFSLLDSISSVIWATGLLVLVAYAGPSWLPGVGISGWWSALIPAVLIVIIARTLGRAEKHTVDEDKPSKA